MIRIVVLLAFARPVVFGQCEASSTAAREAAWSVITLLFAAAITNLAFVDV